MVFKAILDAAFTPAVRLNPDVPPKLEDIINRALEEDRNLRYQHASEMRADLQRLKRDTESGKIAATVAEVPTSDLTEIVAIISTVDIRRRRPCELPLTAGNWRTRRASEIPSLENEICMAAKR